MVGTHQAVQLCMFHFQNELHVGAASRVLWVVEEVTVSLLRPILGHMLISGMASVIHGDGARTQRTQP